MNIKMKANSMEQNTVFIQGVHEALLQLPFQLDQQTWPSGPSSLIPLAGVITFVCTRFHQLKG